MNPLPHTGSGIGRRTFLVRTATAAAAFGFPTIIPARVLGKDAPSKKIQLAQIGCGRIAREMDLPGVLKHHGLARVTAVGDFDMTRARAARDAVASSYLKSTGGSVTVDVFGGYEEIIGRKDIDAVLISTPDHWHAQPVIEAALAGKDIWVQKPVSMTLAEGRAVSDVVRARRNVFQVGSQQRSGQQFHRACELVRNGRIGLVHTVRIGLPVDPAGGNAAEMPVPAEFDYKAWLGTIGDRYYTEDRCHPQKGFGRPGWLRMEASTCGMITGWGSHHIDIMHWALGLEGTGPLRVDAQATFPGKDSFWNVHGKYSVKLTYHPDITVFISDALPNGVRFEGERGWIWVSRGAAAATASDPTAGARPSKALDASDPRILDEVIGEGEIHLHRSPGWDHHLDWLQAVRDRSTPVTTVEAAHRSCSACLVSWIGMKLGKPLAWDPVAERFTDDEANRLTTRPEHGPYGALAAARKGGYGK